MTLADDKPTVTERYGRAINSSNLRAEADRRGDADYLMAAGFASRDGGQGWDRLGAILFRLRGEFDSQRRPPGVRSLTKKSERIKVKRHMRSLEAAVRALREVGRLMSQDTACQWEPGVFEILMHQVIDVWLDPLCDSCEGRGFNGGGRHEHTGVQELCRPCHGSGRRRVHLGQDEVQRIFSGKLLDRMDRACADFEADMARRLHAERREPACT